MDKKAQKKSFLAPVNKDFEKFRREIQNKLGLTEEEWIWLWDKIYSSLPKLGYRKLPKDKPPLVDNPYVYEGEECREFGAFSKGKYAQREADIKHYEQ